ncbi:hypothetical protein [Streptomyces sp. DSM 40750]|uniref:hypothetical protein n=1 Tax=Streptomyces sp. DSM 40750 TaxID=2801030 RepID=UPI00214AF159|nr:hypothetical protein [Streptomyces sp. DSM 40750]UUU23850.1 hypothetical protein JIX55_28345 [Streptomyces sp. DSM 40750]
MKIRSGLVIGTVLSLGLVTGCGGGDSDAETGTKATGSPKSSASATAAGRPVYKGGAIPGLAAKPAWSLAKKDGEENVCAGEATFDSEHRIAGTERDGVCQVGDAFLLAQDLSAPVDESETETQTAHFVAHLYDAATGEERKTFTVKCDYDPTGGTAPEPRAHVQVGEWKDGSPAVLIRTCENTEASGLKAATVKTVYTMYDASGAELGSSALTGEENSDLPVVRGHVKMPDGSTFAPIGGGEDLVLDSYLADKDIFGTGQGYVDNDHGIYTPLRLIDRTTGKSVWKTGDDLTPPDELSEMDGDFEDGDRHLFPLQGDQATLIWSPLGKGDELITTVDLPTGRTVAVGPAVTVTLAATDMAKIVVSPDGKTAVANFGEGALAWNTQTGAELWRQAADDKDIDPMMITPGGVLYATLDESEDATLAVGSKELLDMIPDGMEIPEEFTSDGYTLVQTTDGFFAFEAEKA